ncbi:MAG TPA: glutamine--tRNA ligase/YqeY domain fusion protein [Longimicrobiales bacterium]|nr:glutamine--tRNA ligase/YqeY domain fusion protein [Longimicrobiales bacterium]
MATKRGVGQSGAAAEAAAEALEGRDFIRSIVAGDLRAGTHGGVVVTRFPPEPNGYLHIGHAKAIGLSFGIAAEVPGARCHLRFDDTNPETEDMAYVEAIKRDVAWLGWDWGEHLYFASDYFPQMYAFAEHLIRESNAYVDSQTEDEIRAARGTVTEPGRPGPYRDRSPEESLDLFRRMKAGEFPDGAHVLRGKIDLASPNMLLRDPVLYRIRHASHYRTGDAWCIYPLYDYAHPIEDALECITHSLCTLEFEINRALYDWVVENIPVECRPRQYEFARGNLDYTVMSKRKLLTLVKEGHVRGWDDPRMPTIAGLRRRGFTPDSIRAFWDRMGVAKANSRVDMGKLEFAIRDDLNARAPRVLCVLRPVRVVITNYPRGEVEEIEADSWPHDVPREGTRPLPFSGEIFIDDDDFREDPPADWKRLAPGRAVRLRHAHVIRCDEVVRDDAGAIRELHCTVAPDSGTGGAPADWEVGGAIHWVDAGRSVSCEVRLYDRLFSVADPDATAAEEGRPFTEYLNPESLVVAENARIEPSVANDPPGSRYQFERLGYFISDEEESRPGRLVFNRTVTLRDAWARMREGAVAGAAPGARVRRDAERPADLSPEEHRRLREAAAPERSAALEARRGRLEAELGLDAEDAELLTRDTATADFFEAAVAGGGPAARTANWVINELPRHMGDRAIDGLPFAGDAFGALVALVEDGTLSGGIGRDVLAEMVETGADPGAIVDRRGLRQIADASALEPVVTRVIAANPGKVEEYRGGRTALLGFFMGQVMKETGGKANPEVARRILSAALDSR